MTKPYQESSSQVPWTARALESLVYIGFVGLFVDGLRRIRIGYAATDEGFYLACAMRYSLGDVPFRDEFSNVHRMFDILLWPVFEIRPEITIYELRFGWLCIQLACVLVFYWVWRRFAPPFLVGLACIATFFLPNLAWTPAYHLMGTFFFLLAWALLAEGLIRQSNRAHFGFGIASGIIFFIGAFSYLPLLALGIAPLGLFVAGLLAGETQRGLSRVCGAQLVTLGVLTLATALIILASGLGGDWWQANNSMLDIGPYGLTFREKFAMFLSDLWGQAYLALASALLVAALAAAVLLRSISRLACHPIGVVAFAVASGAAVFLLLFRTGIPVPTPYKFDAFTASMRIFMIAAGLHIGGIILAMRHPRRWFCAPWFSIYIVTLVGSLAFAFVQGFLSSMAWKVMYATIPFLVSGVVLVYREFVENAPSASRKLFAALTLSAICVVLGYATYQARIVRTPRDNKPIAAQDLVEHTFPKLDGILSSPVSVETMENLLQLLSSRIQENDYLLVDGHIPMLYYLTGTRPALNHSWTSTHIPAEVRQASIDWMIEQGRVPTYVVRFMFARPIIEEGKPPAFTHEDPIAMFILENYTKEMSYSVYEIWRLKDSPE